MPNYRRTLSRRADRGRLGHARLRAERTRVVATGVDTAPATVRAAGPDALARTGEPQAEGEEETGQEEEEREAEEGGAEAEEGGAEAARREAQEDGQAEEEEVRLSTPRPSP